MNLKISGCLAAVVFVASLAVVSAQVTVIGSYPGVGSPSLATNNSAMNGVNLSSSGVTNLGASLSTNISGVLSTNLGSRPGETRTQGPPGVLRQLYEHHRHGMLAKVPGCIWAGKYEVTQNEYQTLMGANPIFPATVIRWTV